VLVRLERLDEALAFARGLLVPGPQQAGRLEHAVGRRGADGDQIAVEHHEGEAAVAFQRVRQGEVDDALALLGLDPVIARDERVVLVGLAVAADPAPVLAAGERDAVEEPAGGQFGQLGVVVHEVEDLIAAIVRDPLALQLTPLTFFSRMRSSAMMAITSSLRWSLAWSASRTRSRCWRVSVRGER
jgi:hypothetical protein